MRKIILLSLGVLTACSLSTKTQDNLFDFKLEIICSKPNLNAKLTFISISSSPIELKEEKSPRRAINLFLDNGKKNEKKLHFAQDMRIENLTLGPGEIREIIVGVEGVSVESLKAGDIFSWQYRNPLSDQKSFIGGILWSHAGCGSSLRP
jgi:hypothetical protein